MTSSSTYFLALAIGLSISLVALLAILISPKTNSTHFYLSKTEHIDPKMVKVVNLLGGDLLSMVPKNAQKRSMKNKAVNDVFRASGNPWGVTKTEFMALRVAYAFIASIVGIFFSIVINPGILLSMIIVLALGLLGWNKPISEYRKIANERDADFKKHFPEMLDYLTMIMSDGNYTFTNAIETVLPYLPESAVKEEFTKVTDSVNAGMGTEASLNELSKRLPSPALEAFVNAVNNANKLNTPLDNLMRNQAEKSREDLLNEIELIIQTLPTKTMLTVAPAAIFSMLIIFLVPVVIALLQSF